MPSGWRSLPRTPFVVLNLASLSVDDGDLWWTLAIGRAIWEEGALPSVDPLAYTATSGPYHAGQWLANVLLFSAYQLGGFELLVTLRALLVASVFAVVYEDAATPTPARR